MCASSVADIPIALEVLGSPFVGGCLACAIVSSSMTEPCSTWCLACLVTVAADTIEAEPRTAGLGFAQTSYRRWPIAIPRLNAF
jgi:hypothetical protein